MERKISIIVPVFDVEKYIKQCLDSIINQNYNNYEVIIICDKCNDNSEKIVDEYVKKNNKFKKIFAQNTGLAKAKNIGIKEISGDYILFLDGDDFFQKNTLKTLNKQMEKNYDIIRFQVQDINAKTIKKHNEIPFEVTNGIDAFNKIITYHYIEPSWCYAYNTKFWKENNFKFMEGCIAEDYGLTPIIITKAKTVKSIEFIGYNYRQRENSLMSNQDYSKKIQKMEDMIKQADNIKNIKLSDNIISFINNSLIYYTTNLKYKDYKKYNKILKQKKCFNHLKNKNIKTTIKNIMIKSNAYIFYNYLVR